MEKTKNTFNIWMIVFIIIILFVLVLEYFAIFTDAFDLPLSASEMEEKTISTHYDMPTGESLFDIVEEDIIVYQGDSPLPYMVISSYSQYKELLEKIDETSPSYANEVKALIHDVGYTRAYFNKYSLILVEEKPYHDRNFEDRYSVNIKGNELNIRLIHNYDGMHLDKAGLTVVPISNKALRKIDKITADTMEW